MLPTKPLWICIELAACTYDGYPLFARRYVAQLYR
ncbi:hypothetical protein ZBT109_1521 [Zymobacter palmae]|uniref:Uncharacterized protein n=1 Tax=Zymobacter palmae TaxID=33074 RepID=A0A348HF76_9GAMM|nr:hypothetical protein ZBT109_1521 [Zymobacter palmae]